MERDDTDTTMIIIIVVLALIAVVSMIAPRSENKEISGFKIDTTFFVIKQDTINNRLMRIDTTKYSVDINKYIK